MRYTFQDSTDFPVQRDFIQDLQNFIAISKAVIPLEKSVISNSIESLDDLEKTHILIILNKYSWNISRSAKALKVDRVTLYNKISKYGLKPAD